MRVGRRAPTRLERIDSRIEAHVDALVLADEHAWPLLENALSTGELLPTAAAALVIASSDIAAHRRWLVDGFRRSSGGALEGLRNALELRAGGRLREELCALTATVDTVSLAVCSVAVAHDPREATRISPRWFEHRDAYVRRSVWMIEARLARDDRHRLRDADLRRAVADEDRGVRRAALWAAARSGHRGLLEHLRAAAELPRLDAMEEHWLLAVLGHDADVPRILALGQAKVLGWDRFRVLAACGRAPVVEELLRTMREADAPDGALAADAFFRITGVRVDRPQRVPLTEPTAGPDELGDEVRVCDPRAAAQAWSLCKGRMAAHCSPRSADTSKHWWRSSTRHSTHSKKELV